MDGYCISIGAGAVNSILEKGFGIPEIREQLKGNVTILMGEKPIDVEWEVTEAPTVSFADLESGATCISKDGAPITFESTMFTITSIMKLAVSGKEGSTLPLTIVSDTFFSGEDKASFKAVGLVMLESYSENDRTILGLMCEDLIEAVNTALGFDGSKIPVALNYSYLRSYGIWSNKPGIQRVNNVLGIWGSSEEGQAVAPMALPDNVGIALAVTYGMFTGTVNALFNQYKADCVYDDKDSIDLGITTAKYHIHAAVNNVACIATDSTSYQLLVDPNASVSAGITTFLGDVGINYKTEFSPDPIGAIAQLKIINNSLAGAVATYGGFTVDLKPQGNIIEWLSSEVLKLLTGTLCDKVATAYCQHITLPFQHPIPDGSIEVGELYSLKMKLKDLALNDGGGVKIITGNIDVSIGE